VLIGAFLLLPLTTLADVVHQLRIYEIFDNNKQAFHDRLRDQAMRIMAKYDFHVIAMWEAKNGTRTEFGEIQDRTLHVTSYWPRKELPGN
jgi:hypothetical protein